MSSSAVEASEAGGHPAPNNREGIAGITPGNSSNSGPEKQQQLLPANSPFDDSIQRTKWLIRYIRLRKQRAEDELARQNEAKRRKKDARASLQSALIDLEAGEEEMKRCEHQLEELVAKRHLLFSSFKEVVSRVEERKRMEEEEAMKVAAEQEQLRLARLRLEQEQLQQQLKQCGAGQQQLNPQLLGMLASLFGSQPIQQEQQPTQQRPASTHHPQGFMQGGVNAGSQHQISTAFPSSATAATNFTLGSQQPRLTQSPAVQSTSRAVPQPGGPSAMALPPQTADPTAFYATILQQLQQQHQVNAAVNFLRQHYSVSAAAAGGATPQVQPVASTLSSALQSQQQQAILASSARPAPASLQSTDVFLQTLLASMGANQRPPGSGILGHPAVPHTQPR